MKNFSFSLGQRSLFYKQALATFTSSLIPMCAGMSFGIISVMLPQLREDSSFDYDPRNDSWIASITVIAMIFGSLSYGIILDSYGRKITHIIAGIPFILGYIFIACANSTGLILVGRFIIGLSSCATGIVSMVYIGEITDPNIRSAALFLPVVMGYGGLLFSHTVGYYLAWRISSAVLLVPALISLVASIFLKESPLWLIAKGRRDEGIDNFRWFRGTGEASEIELKLVFERQDVKPRISMKTTLKIACKMSFIKPMVVLMVLMVNYQFSGMNDMSVYSQDIFERTFSGKVNAFQLTIAMDCIMSVVSIVCCILGKFVSKKKALLVCNFGAVVSIVGLILSLSFLKADNYLWIHITTIAMYICFASAIIGISLTFVPELLPNTVRGFGSGIISIISYLLLFFIVKMTPDIMDFLGEPALFAVYGISILISGFILSFILPETKGKTLQAIEDSYDKKKDESTSI